MENLAWKILPSNQTVIHRCAFGTGASFNTPVSITAHPTRPEGCVVVRKDWNGPVMESRATCGCVRWRGVRDARINSRLQMEVLVSAKDQTLMTAPGLRW